jgi:hypothetical protein
LPSAAAAEPELRPVPLDALRASVTRIPHAFTERGLELGTEESLLLVLPFEAQVVELDVTASGIVQLTWAAKSPGFPYLPFGPPWRYVTLSPGRSTVSMDYRTAESWTTRAELQVGLTGPGSMIIHAMRALPLEPDPGRQRAAFDRARLWAPESIGHTTINFLTRSFWSASERVWLSDVVAVVAALAFLAALTVPLLLRRRPRPALALAIGGVVAIGLWDAHMLVRFLPAFELAPHLDPETRIRENYFVAPDVGAVAALARKTLGPAERVGVIGRQKDWFGPQAICFNLAPRPCVFMAPNEQVHHGIGGVGALRDDEIDAIVSLRGDWTPPGFEREAAIGQLRYVARRRR